MDKKLAMKILKGFHDKSALLSIRTALETVIPELMESEDKNKPNGGIVMEDFNEGNGSYKVNLAYLNEEQVKEVEELVKKWNPELKESEDERIRKALIDYFDDANKADENPLQSYGIHTDKAIAWLEKQGESISLPKFTFDDVLALQCAMEAAKKVQKDNDLYEQLKSLHDRLHDAYWLEKQGEQKSKKVSLWKHWKDGIAGNGEGKSIYLIKSGYTYSLSPCLSFECDYIELSELDELLSEKQGEQKPVWSDEDETILSEIIDEIEYTKLETKDYDVYNRLISWLKSLKKRVLPKIEWSKEDEAMVLSIKQIINCASFLNLVPEKLDRMDKWLKSLRNRV